MRPTYKATELDSVAAPSDAFLGVTTDGTARVTFLPRRSAGNDPARSSVVGFSVAATSYELMRAASARRALVLAEMIAASIQAIGSIARQVYARYRQRREERATYDALSQLGDWTLRDIGFDRSELRSIAAEMTGTAEQTRLRVLSHLRR